MTDRASLRPGQMARPSAKTKERYGISILFSLPTVGPFPPAAHPQQTGIVADGPGKGQKHRAKRRSSAPLPAHVQPR